MIYLVYFLVFIFGLSVGSFVNCLAWRLNANKTIFGRSMCPRCGYSLAWYDNIPLLSFILLKAKCRHCRQGISHQYWAVELIVAGLFVLAFYLSPVVLATGEVAVKTDWLALSTLLRNWLLIAVMAVIFIMDLRWQIIVDKVSLPACAVILFWNLALGFSWQNLLLAGIIGAGFFLLQFVVSQGKWIGGGDLRLGLLMGLALGWPMILVAMFLAYLMGSVVGLSLIAAGKLHRKSKIPFGCFLSVATIITLFWGNELLTWYLKLFS